MSRWLHFTRVRVRVRCPVQPRQFQFQSRLLSSRSSIEHVRVPCASAGNITVSLHNINKQDTSSPLVILLPPVSQPRPDSVASLPECFHDYPTAVINYRWQISDEEERPAIPLHWPTPLHDVNFGYSWIRENLGSGTGSSSEPRPAYVYGSYLGASLAAGLALTNSHIPMRSEPMTIRGLIAHNGIYNWTMFLPDHPIHKPKPPPSFKIKKGGLLPFPTINDDGPTEEEGIFSDLRDHAPTLFRDPSNLFDPFASACLFFHTPDLHVPDDFTTPLSQTDALGPAFSAAINKLANHKTSSSSASPSSPSSSSTPSSTPSSPTYSPDTEWEPEPQPPPEQFPEEPPEPPEEEEEESAHTILARAAHLAKQARPARKAYLAFPPLYNPTLRLPATLLIHSVPDSDSDPDAQSQRRGGGRSRSRNNFAVQARELAGVMLRSLDMYEFKRGKRVGRVAPWERDGQGQGEWEWDGEGEGRVVEELDAEVLRDAERERWDAILRRVQSFEAVGAGTVSDGVGGDGGGGKREGEEGGSLKLDGEGEAVVGEWLRERIDEDLGDVGANGV